MSVRFGTSDAIAYAWLRFKEQPGALIGMMVAVIAIVFVPMIGYTIFMALGYDVIAILLYVASIVLQLYLGLGVYKISLKVADKQGWQFADLFTEGSKLLPYVGATILHMLITFGGCILFILPGIYWATRFGMYPYFVVDKGQGPVEALKSSWALTEGSFWDLVGFQSALLILVLLSMIPLGLGLLITIPMSGVVMAYVYRQLDKHPYVPTT